MFFGVKKNKKFNFKKVVQEEICRWTHAQGQIQIKHQERECPQPGSADCQGRASGILGCYVRISEFSTLTLKLLGPKLEHVDDILGARNVTTSQAYMGVMFTIMRLPGKGPPRCSQVKRKKKARARWLNNAQGSFYPQFGVSISYLNALNFSYSLSCSLSDYKIQQILSCLFFF